MGALDPDKKQKAERYAQDDPRVNPNGLYSGMAKRLAVTDDSFVDIGGMPRDLRNVGRLKRENIAKAIDTSRGRFS